VLSHCLKNRCASKTHGNLSSSGGHGAACNDFNSGVSIAIVDRNGNDVTATETAMTT